MATKVKVKKQQPEMSKKSIVRRFIIIPAAVILIAAIVITVVLLQPGATPTSTLKRFYSALYTFDGSVEDILDCVLDSARDQAEVLYMPAGSSVLGIYRMDIVSKVGENVSAHLKVLDESNASAGILQQARQLHPEASHAKTYRFSLTLKGDTGSLEYIGIASLIKIGGTWYMTSPNPEIAERSALESGDATLTGS